MASIFLRNTIVILAIIATTTIVLGVISASYSAGIIDSIKSSATDKVRASTNDKAIILSDRMSAKFTDIFHNLQIISDGPSVHAALRSGDFSSADPLLRSGQQTTGNITDSYNMIDRNGRIVWTAGSGNSGKTSQGIIGQDFSLTKWFTYLRDNKQPYIAVQSGKSEDNAEAGSLPDSYVIAYPVLEQENTSFQGAVYTVVPFEKINSFTSNFINLGLSDTNASLIDNQGDIIASTISANLGHNIYDPQFLSARLPKVITNETQTSNFLRFMREGLVQNNTGVADFELYGKAAALAYAPVMVNNVRVMTAYTSAQYFFALDVASAIQHQAELNAIFITTIGASALAASIVVLTWNKRLKLLVGARTKELQSSNESLETRTKELNKANEILLEKTDMLEKMTKSLEKLNEELAVSNKRLEAANEQLKAHDENQREFINIAAHELRTPIMPILGVADSLENAAKNDSGQDIRLSKPELDMLIRNAKKLLNLSSDILHVARIDSNSLELKKESVDLNDLVADAVMDAEKSLPKGSDVIVDFEPLATGIMVQADRSKLMEVLSNLLNNAIKFTSSGTIKVVTDRQGHIDAARALNDNTALVQVIDTGKGIDPTVMPKLFTKFTTKPETGGTGLGLYISKAIIEAHGGRIWAENNKDRSGAIFSFALPLASEAATSSGIRPDSQSIAEIDDGEVK